jgi:hypothetical protein
LLHHGSGILREKIVKVDSYWFFRICGFFSLVLIAAHRGAEKHPISYYDSEVADGKVGRWDSAVYQSKLFVNFL